jgi:hypothetical protein
MALTVRPRFSTVGPSPCSARRTGVVRAARAQHPHGIANRCQRVSDVGHRRHLEERNMVRSDRSSSAPRPRWRLAVAAAVVATAASCLWLAACSTTTAADDSHSDKEYRTGSNIAVRDRNAPGDARTYDPSSVQDAARSALPRPPVGLKGG